jgi:hypothetical protein
MASLHGSSRHVADIVRNMCNPLDFPNIFETFQIDLTQVLFYLRHQLFT